MSRFQKVLVANRGEIAVRVLRGAQAQGYATVAVYSQADAGALHAHVADEAVCIGPAPVSQSYMNMDALLDAARRTGAQAIHPGYGFLAENAVFALACEEAGIVFIGPSHQAIELMGNKRGAKIAMQEAGVPCVPGYQGEEQDDGTLIAHIHRIGFPVMIKAAAGGGGRGMRLVDADSDLHTELQSARSEALHGFGSDELILEKAIIRPRHVEIQVFGDEHGNYLHLGERDCSVQRRHQKVIEEAPSPAVDADLRRRMGETAVKAAHSCDYVGAGTVEFLLDEDRNFYFLEMNTRLQVEHPVTELVTGQDLVAWQLQVAQGEPLPLSQEEICMQGHAMEVRLYAEEPGENFMPQTGTILDWQPAGGAGVRVDAGIQVGQQVTPYYDPILCKIICHGRNRDEARTRLIRALAESRTLGVNTNNRFLRELLAHETFASGAATTAFIDQEFGDNDTLRPYVPDATEFALAALVYCHQFSAGLAAPGLRLPVRQQLLLAQGETRRIVSVGPDPRLPTRIEMAVDGNEIGPLELETVHDDQIRFVLDGVRRSVAFAVHGGTVHLATRHGSSEFSLHTWDPPAAQDGAGSGQVIAPMDGAVVSVAVETGQTVDSGQLLLVMEAMKMEHSLRAAVAGTVLEVRARPGDQVRGRQLLVEIEPA